MRWLVLGLWLLPVGAEAQAYGEVRFAGETRVEVVTEARPRGEVRVSVRAGSQRVTVYEGREAQAWSDASARGVLVGLLGGTAGLSAVLVPVEAGRLGAPRAVTIRRPEARGRAPVGIAVAARGDDGFALVWQEASVSQPASMYTTHVVEVSAEGRAGEARASSATWPIADVAWLPAQGRYYFLLYYAAGGRPDGTRFCGVHVDPGSLTATEHPFWVTRPGQLDEAELVVSGARVFALYRDGGALLEAEVTDGSWGREAPASRDRGAIDDAVAYGGRADGGAVEVARVRLDTVQ